jgi:hypothetical protein
VMASGRHRRCRPGPFRQNGLVTEARTAYLPAVALLCSGTLSLVRLSLV